MAHCFFRNGINDYSIKSFTLTSDTEKKDQTDFELVSTYVHKSQCKNLYFKYICILYIHYFPHHFVSHNGLSSCSLAFRV